MFLIEIASMSSYEFAQFRYFQMKQAKAELTQALKNPACTEEQKEAIQNLLQSLEEDQKAIVKQHGIMEH